MGVTNEVCEAVLAEYASRFPIESDGKDMALRIARIAMDVFKIAFEHLADKESA